MIAKRIVVWIVIVLLAAEFTLAGASKLSPSSGWARMFVGWGFPAWFRVAIGATEIACALALFIPRSRRWACAVLLVVMAGAAVTHLTHGEPTARGPERRVVDPHRTAGASRSEAEHESDARAADIGLKK